MNNLLKLITNRPIIYLQKRWKNPRTHWSVINKKKFPKDRALENLDDFYGSVFGKNWKSIRIALLTEHKYVAMVNTFGNTEETCKQLEQDGAINIKSLVELSKQRLEINTNNTEVPQNVDSHYKLSNKLDSFIKQKELQEKLSIYPSDKSSHLIDDIILKNSKPVQDQAEENSLIKNNEIVDYKKSLEQTSAEDLEIDQSRLINLEHGSGGLYEYIPATNIKGMEDWIPESDYYKYYSTTNDFPIHFELEKEFIFPENLELYTYEKGNCSTFMPPKQCITGVHSHFLMDGSSILPPLLLNIEKGDIVLDACSAPGGKSLLMLQTLYPKLLICNDIQENRLKRVHNIMKQYIIDFETKWENKYCFLTKMDARMVDDYEHFDKILVDVPCTTDRHSVMENDNNIFKPSRIKERLKIPEQQSDILANCIRLLKPGGSLIYSTCSLSPIQNDGVVHMALQKVFTEYGITTTIIDLSMTVQLFEDIFKFENSKTMKYGQLVLPHLSANFGPMYFCKIKRN